MPDGGFDFALAIGITHAARQRDYPVMLKHVAIERIESGIVDVRRDNAFAQIIEYDRACDTS